LACFGAVFLRFARAGGRETPGSSGGENKIRDTAEGARDGCLRDLFRARADRIVGWTPSLAKLAGVGSFAQNVLG